LIGDLGKTLPLEETTVWRIICDIMSSATAEPKIANLAELQSLPQPDLIQAVTHGLPAMLIREMARQLDVTLDDAAGLLRMNSRILHRRLDDGVLDLGESERLWELSRLFCRAEEVLENKKAAVHWFKNPVQALGWDTPLAYARTAVGIRELDNILGRIEHGVYS
jgi:putative toxin-antitoxin system antitoxin component (TIGR02293 family)